MGVPLKNITAFTVAGYNYDGDYVARAFESTGDLRKDLEDNAAWVAYWGWVAAEAKREFDMVEARYRADRDAYVSQRAAGTFEGPDGDTLPKISKTAAESEWRTTSGYLDWHRLTSEAARAWNVAQYLYDASQTRAHALQSITKIEIDEKFVNRGSAA